MPSARNSHDHSKSKTGTATIYDVAKVAGVGASTVARVMKQKGYVAPATREKVLAVAKSLDFSVNPAARVLATGRTGVIAFITGELDKIYYARLAHLMEEELRRDGYQMKLLHSRDDFNNLVDETRSSSVDGAIISGMHDLSKLPEFWESGLARHCVFLDTVGHEEVDHVRIDLRAGVEAVIKMMVEQGRTRIAYVGGSNATNFDPTLAAEDRLKTYVSVRQQAGHELEFINSYPHLPQAERIHHLIDYFRQQGCPGGLVCLHDEIAMMTHCALAACGFKVPEDALLVGCDGLPQMEWFYPGLSAVAQPLEDACATAWLYLKQRLKDGELPAQSSVLPATLQVRGSLDGQFRRPA